MKPSKQNELWNLVVQFHDCGTVFDFGENSFEVKFNAMKKLYFNFLIATFLLSIVRIENLSAGIFSRKTDSIQIVVDKNQLVLPGESFKIGVISYHPKEKIRKTIGMDGGSVLWWRYKTEIVGGENPLETLANKELFFVNFFCKASLGEISFL